MGPPAKVPKKGGRSLRNLNPRKALRVVITNSQNKENGQSSITCYSTRVNTGMEKDEEKELHLQVAMQTQKASLGGTLRNAAAIPIPRVENVGKLEYAKHRHLRKRVRTDQVWVRAVPPDAYCMRADQYELDEEDDEWLRQRRAGDNPLRLTDEQFEQCVAVMECESQRNVISMAAAFIKLASMDREVVSLVYDYWLSKRLVRVLTHFIAVLLLEVVPDDVSVRISGAARADRARLRGQEPLCGVPEERSRKSALGPTLFRTYGDGPFAWRSIRLCWLHSRTR